MDGASAESAYQTQGNCLHADRVAGIYVTKFLDAITYDPWFGDPVATKSFNWHNEWAWESDLLPGGGVDTVDFMVFSGHGYGQGLHNVPYNSLHYYTLNSSTNFHPYGE